MHLPHLLWSWVAPSATSSWLYLLAPLLLNSGSGVHLVDLDTHWTRPPVVAPTSPNAEAQGRTFKVSSSVLN